MSEFEWLKLNTHLFEGYDVGDNCSDAWYDLSWEEALEKVAELKRDNPIADVWIRPLMYVHP